MRYVSVRAVNSGGHPVRDVRISLYVYQFLASGFTGAQNTNSEGLTQFQLDADQGAEIAVYVNGHEKVKRGSIKAEYTVVI